MINLNSLGKKKVYTLLMLMLIFCSCNKKEAAIFVNQAIVAIFGILIIIIFIVFLTTLIKRIKLIARKKS